MKRILLALVLCNCSLCHGQANDVALSVGAMSSPVPFAVQSIACINPDPLQRCGAPVKTTTKLTYEGTFAHRVANLHVVSFHLELPVLGTPQRTVKQGFFRQDFSSAFFTPGMRVKFSLPFVSPFAVIGGGLAHFSSSATTQIPIGATSNNTGAFEFGAGADLKTPIPHLALRGEFRQFRTGNQGFPGAQFSHTDRFAGAGIVFRF